MSESPPLAAWPRAAFENLLDVLGHFAWASRQRGREYAVSERVLEFEDADAELKGRVRGSRIYSVWWRWNGRGWDHGCNCSIGHSCKHAYALACRALRVAATSHGLDERHLKRVLPPEWVASAPAPPRPVAAPMRPADTEAIVEKLGAWARDHASGPSHRLRVLLGLLEDAGGVRVTMQVRVTSPSLDDAPRTQRQLQALRTDAMRTPQLLSPPQARLLALLVDPVFGSALLWEDAPGVLSTSALSALLDRFADSAFVTWGDALPPRLALRAGIKPGGRSRLANELLDVAPAVHVDGGEVTVRLAVRHADGRERGLDEGLLLRADEREAHFHPSLLVLDGVFHRLAEEPPRDVLRLLARPHGLRVGREEGARVLTELGEGFANVRETLDGLTRIQPVVVSAMLLLRDDWIELRAWAHDASRAWSPGQEAPEDLVRFERRGDGSWVRVAAAAPAGEIAPSDLPRALDDGAPPSTLPSAPEPAPLAGETWIEKPDPAALAPFEAWVASLSFRASGSRGAGGAAPPTPTDEGGLWLKLTPRVADTLLVAWDERPRDVRWFGDRAAERLLQGVALPPPTLRVTGSGVDWFEVSAEWEAEAAGLTREELAKLRASSGRVVRLGSGWTRRDRHEDPEGWDARLADLGIEIGAGSQRLTLWQLAQASGDNFAALERLGADSETLDAVRRLRDAVRGFRGLPAVPPPVGLDATLRPYQQTGFEFLSWTASLGLGGVLADDMGLGKTVQTLAWLQALKNADPDGGPALVVCPTSVVHNWLREAQRFTPGLRALAFERGGNRHALRREAASHDLLVTNYALLRRDADAWREVPLRAVVFDEAQNVKNPSAEVTKAAQRLRAKHRLALTGTPLENRALDVWSIVSCVAPGYLGGRKAFEAAYDRPDAPAHTRRRLAARLRPVMLRRLKSQVELDLPPRIEERLDCPMTPGQKKLYADELTRTRALVQTLAASPEELQKRRFVVLAALTRLRQLCCHPALAGGKKSVGSGKFTALAELLEPLLEAGHKVLVYSQFVECIRLLEEFLDGLKVKRHTLTGETTRRGEVVDAFERDTDPCVFLISLKAGGTGLNLTSAAHVVLFDPWWNPAVEAQAIDRAHRIGQTRAVVAYRLLAADSIEERIADLQARKAALARDVLGEDGFARGLSPDDVRYLLADPEN